MSQIGRLVSIMVVDALIVTAIINPITPINKLPLTVVSPFYGLCEIFEKMTAIYGVLTFQKQPYMVLKQNWRNYSL
jgi:hypothetical protein